MDHEGVNDICNLSIQEQVCGDQKGFKCTTSSDNVGLCAICLDKIPLQETALIKDCEHAYCVTCILRWAMYSQRPLCPQCKHPFEFLNVHRSLDGGIRDYLFEESVCLLVRATWFIPLKVETLEEIYEQEEDYQYEDYDDGHDEEDDLDDFCINSSHLRIGNRRWGGNGYVRAGRQEARPIKRENAYDFDAGPSRGPNKNEVPKDPTGRRAKRALKREAADKAAAEKHQKHLARLGRK